MMLCTIYKNLFLTPYAVDNAVTSTKKDTLSSTRADQIESNNKLGNSLMATSASTTTQRGMSAEKQATSTSTTTERGAIKENQIDAWKWISVAMAHQDADDSPVATYAFFFP
mmetsp:Transcript_38589/g.44971  ORF Transcript_38589/g.44971 Transcript_38589/m.44971 type:complete len:112 (+) Transcript_38589:62-397(+)|eukprot:CAMPEP_0194426952 /NCGR_PEP_ID=MMETSP0176-20130528/33297_1 /TAXON_ID=216777 /ORGANISM="Proboscia alata, Strain PI-D3" /LENGTH=111 /DNA_ID=CAMNT_0039238273 /DNA_START=61 /DNA_END=396 /DNA_ORIENTATION=+